MCGHKGPETSLDIRREVNAFLARQLINSVGNIQTALREMVNLGRPVREEEIEEDVSRNRAIRKQIAPQRVSTKDARHPRGSRSRLEEYGKSGRKTIFLDVEKTYGFNGKACSSHQLYEASKTTEEQEVYIRTSKKNRLVEVELVHFILAYLLSLASLFFM
ncbi:unnamed protein product [Caenorhabditis nigoni]